MKTYNTQSEIDADIIDGVLKCDDDITITFDCVINANIEAGDISALNIKAINIDALNIDALNINAQNINAGDIKAWDIDAVNINAGDIKAWDIDACDISFYAVCFAYEKLSCKSISGRRENAKFFCLDSEVVMENNK